MQQNQSGTAPAGDLPENQSGAAPGQWKTLREIADEIGTGKMNVYRYAKTAGLEGVTLPGAGNGQTATGCNGSDDQLEELHRLRQEVESLTADRDRLRDQLDDATADRETLIKQVNQMRGEITGHAAEVKRLVDQLDQLRQDHREELDRIQAGHAAELDRLRTDHRQQLDDLRAQLDTLAQLTQNAQTLHAAQLQKEERKAIETAATPEEITPQDKPPTLWQRIFGKK